MNWLRSSNASPETSGPRKCAGCEARREALRRAAMTVLRRLSYFNPGFHSPLLRRKPKPNSVPNSYGGSE